MLLSDDSPAVPPAFNSRDDLLPQIALAFPHPKRTRLICGRDPYAFTGSFFLFNCNEIPTKNRTRPLDENYIFAWPVYCSAQLSWFIVIAQPHSSASLCSLLVARTMTNRP